MKRLRLIIAMVVTVAIGAGVAIFFAVGGSQLSADKPNVIMIVVDTLRADHLSQYGFHLETSPGLDEFASHSTRFENCHTPAPWTRPAVTTIFTGMHPLHHSVTRKTSLKDRADTLAERLQLAGLETVGISLNPNVSLDFGLGQGFEIFVEEFGDRATAYTDISQMHRLAQMWFWAKGERRDPFFLFMLPMNVHGPYKVPKGKKRKALLGRAPVKGFKYYSKLMKDIMKRGKAAERRPEVTPVMLQSLREKYATAVRYSTDNIAEFFEFLKKQGQYDNSLIILTADHGEELYDHEGFSHGYTVYDEVLHVPLFIKEPHQHKARVVEEHVEITDIYPTILELLDEEVPAQLDGRSLVPLIEGEKRDESVADKIFVVAWEKRCVAQGILRWPWKLIRIQQNYEGLTDAEKLFNLQDDPGEFDDMASRRPELIDKLTGGMRKVVSGLEGGEHYAETRDLDPEMEERLKALGYLQ
ncbi:MAG: sulfatase [Deltaproteobacteria bacterium]|nr:sulfatase [Deltaproteobacteria bacterium]